MNRIRRADLDILVKHTAGPCVSLFMPCTPGSRDSREDAVRIRELADQAERELIDQGMRRPEAEQLVAAIRALPDDEGNWQYRGQGLAAFAAPAFFQFLHATSPLNPALFVDERFHIVPLVQQLAGDDRFFVLALSQDAVRLFEGDATEIKEVPLVDLPRALDSALNAELEQGGGQKPLLQDGSIGRPASALPGKRGATGRRQVDLGQLMNVVAGVIDRHLNGEHAPLVLACVEGTAPLFRAESGYKYIVDEFIAGAPDHLTPHQLHTKAWPLVQPALAGHERWCEQRLLEAGGAQVSFGLANIVPAAISGRVSALFLDCSQDRWGRYDPANHAAEVHDQRLPGDQNLVELAAAETIRLGGDVFPLRPGSRIQAEEAEALLRF
jgi:hypothetical protein